MAIDCPACGPFGRPRRRLTPAVRRSKRARASVDLDFSYRPEAEKQFSSTRKQASRYTKRVLATTELASYRCLIVVSRNRLSVPPDTTEGDVRYRLINIAV